ELLLCGPVLGPPLRVAFLLRHGWRDAGSSRRCAMATGSALRGSASASPASIAYHSAPIEKCRHESRRGCRAGAPGPGAMGAVDDRRHGLGRHAELQALGLGHALDHARVAEVGEEPALALADAVENHAVVRRDVAVCDGSLVQSSEAREQVADD